MRVTLIVQVETQPDGEYYADQDDLVRQLSGWIQSGLYDRDDIESVVIYEH